MKTNDVHAYHGITLRNDGYGWAIQIRLNGTYQVIRSFAATIDEAAYRHDVALSKLDAFTDANARPNFPDTFKDIDISRAADNREDYLKFWDALHERFSKLCQDAEAVGMDVCEMRSQRAQLAERIECSQRIKRDLNRSSFRQEIFKLTARVAILGFDAEKSKRLVSALTHLGNIFDEATK